MSLDWVSMGILATGLTLAMQNFGPWFGMNVVFLVGVFALPRVLPTGWSGRVKLLPIALGGALFLYANYGAAMPVVPAPSTVLGPLASYTLTDTTTKRLYALVNSVVAGPLLVGAFGVLMNHLLTRPELVTTPLVRHALPEGDPDAVVATSAAFGTVFYLLVVATATDELVVLP